MGIFRKNLKNSIILNEFCFATIFPFCMFPMTFHHKHVSLCLYLHIGNVRTFRFRRKIFDKRDQHIKCRLPFLFNNRDVPRKNIHLSPRIRVADSRDFWQNFIVAKEFIKKKKRINKKPFNLYIRIYCIFFGGRVQTLIYIMWARRGAPHQRTACTWVFEVKLSSANESSCHR